MICQYSFIWVFLVIKLHSPVYARNLSLAVSNTSPQIGARVEFQCHGFEIDQRGNNFFENGGKLLWLADETTIARYTLGHKEVFDKYYSVEFYYTPINTADFSLQIAHVSIDVGKSYRCVLLSAQNDTLAESRRFILRVQYPPDHLYPQCTIDSVPSASNSVTLKCRSETAYPPVDLNWISPQGRSAQKAKIAELDRFTETYLDISIPSSADYVCQSNYTADHSDSEQIIRHCRLHAPKILLSIETEEIVEGREVVYVCSIDATPEPDHLSWISTPALIARNNTIYYDGNSVTRLILSNITARDNGSEITCSSTNLLGTSFKTKLLIVKTFGTSTGIYVPPFRVTLKPEIARVDAGDMATFECNVSSYKSSYELKWFYWDTEIRSQIRSDKDKFVIEHVPAERLRVRDLDVRENNTTISCVVSVDGQERLANAKLFVVQTIQVSVTPVAMFASNYPNGDFDHWIIIYPVLGVLLLLFVVMIAYYLTLVARRKNNSNIKDQQELSHTVGNVNSGYNSYATTVTHLGLPPVPQASGGGVVSDAKTLEDSEEEYEDMDALRMKVIHVDVSESSEYQTVVEHADDVRSNCYQNGLLGSFHGSRVMPEPIY